MQFTYLISLNIAIAVRFISKHLRQVVCLQEHCFPPAHFPLGTLFNCASAMVMNYVGKLWVVFFFLDDVPCFHLPPQLYNVSIKIERAFLWPWYASHKHHSANYIRDVVKFCLYFLFEVLACDILEIALWIKVQYFFKTKICLSLNMKLINTK